MPFTPKDWRDYPDTTTPLTAAAIEDAETRLAAYTDAEVNSLSEAVADDIADAVDSAVETSQAYVDAPITTNVQTGTTYTIAINDAGNVIVELTNNSEVTVTLPGTGFATNAQVEFCALGAAGTTFVAGSGATLNSASGLVDLEQNCTAVARHRGGGEWLLTGALS